MWKCYLEFTKFCSQAGCLRCTRVQWDVPWENENTWNIMDQVHRDFTSVVDSGWKRTFDFTPKMKSIYYTCVLHHEFRRLVFRNDIALTQRLRCESTAEFPKKIISMEREFLPEQQIPFTLYVLKITWLYRIIIHSFVLAWQGKAVKGLIYSLC
jgi:hypothetical protein